VHVRALSVRDFRSYAEADLDLDPGITALIGPNGQGKTNLVEAIGYVATLSSHRTATDAPLVRAGAERAVVRATVVHGWSDGTDGSPGRDTVIEVEITPGKANRARLRGAPVARAREILGELRTVMFAPEDLAIVKGDPAQRRTYLDELLVARSPRFAAVHADYERVLKQRNALLKSAGSARRRGADLATLDVWDSHLAGAGAAVLAGRHELVAALRPLVDKAYSGVSGGGGPAHLDYRSSLPDDLAESGDQDLLAAAMIAALSESRERELDRGVTLVGPHRDDLGLSLGELPARGYASHGESWSFALALRLAAYDLLRGDGGEPVLVLDDVFAELDEARRRSLAELVAPAEQVLVTAAVAEDVPARLNGAHWDVTSGEVRRVR
jgi:DNA replication and repair protein RecF